MSVQQGTAHRPWVDRILSINGWLVFGFLYLPDPHPRDLLVLGQSERR